ncbi:MAG TPA: SDR family oxidoreductase [Planctomycetaceae bacterium]|nr:SDR family oxidoreductase [Planctomycetaceae bacterium]
MSTFADLSERWVAITGASTGIGRAIAEECARAGANLVVHYHASTHDAENMAATARELGVDAIVRQCDVRDPVALGRFVDEVWNETRGIDAWVHNAGVDVLTGDAAKWTFPEKLAALLSVDVTGTLLATKDVGERMKARGSGAIITIGWDQADQGMSGDSGELFAASKNAIMGYTRSLAVSLAPQVRVNCIAPGWIQTKWGVTASPAWQARVLAETPLKRWGQPEDIAKLARFLISDDANYLTGQVINANGGAVR